MKQGTFEGVAIADPADGQGQQGSFVDLVEQPEEGQGSFADVGDFAQVGAGEMLGRLGTDWKSYVTGAHDFSEVGEVFRARRLLHEYDQSGAVSDPEDAAWLRDFLQFRRREKTVGGMAVEGLFESLRFAEDLLLGGAILKGGAKAGGKLLAREAFEAGLQSAAEKNLVRQFLEGGMKTAAATGLAETGKEAAAAAGLDVASATTARFQENLLYAQNAYGLDGDTAGSFVAGLLSDQEGVVEAARTAGLNQLIEGASEGVGGALGQLGPLKRVSALQHWAVQRLLGKGATVPEALEAVARGVAYDGLFQEMLEERAGDVARAAAGLAPWSEVVPELDEIAAEMIVLGVPAAVGLGGAMATRGGAAPPPGMGTPEAGVGPEISEKQDTPPGGAGGESSPAAVEDAPPAPPDLLDRLRSVPELAETSEAGTAQTPEEATLQAREAKAGRQVWFADLPRSVGGFTTPEGEIVLRRGVPARNMESYAAHESVHVAALAEPEAASLLLEALERHAPGEMAEARKSWEERYRASFGKEPPAELGQEEAAALLAESLPTTLSRLAENPEAINEVLEQRGFLQRILDALAATARKVGIRIDGPTIRRLRAALDPDVPRGTQVDALKRMADVATLLARTRRLGEGELRRAPRSGQFLAEEEGGFPAARDVWAEGPRVWAPAEGAPKTWSETKAVKRLRRSREPVTVADFVRRFGGIDLRGLSRMTEAGDFWSRLQGKEVGRGLPSGLLYGPGSKAQSRGLAPEMMAQRLSEVGFRVPEGISSTDWLMEALEDELGGHYSTLHPDIQDEVNREMGGLFAPTGRPSGVATEERDGLDTMLGEVRQSLRARLESVQDPAERQRTQDVLDALDAELGPTFAEVREAEEEDYPVSHEFNTRRLREAMLKRRYGDVEPFTETKRHVATARALPGLVPETWFAEGEIVQRRVDGRPPETDDVVRVSNELHRRGAEFDVGELHEGNIRVDASGKPWLIDLGSVSVPGAEFSEEMEKPSIAEAASAVDPSLPRFAPALNPIEQDADIPVLLDRWLADRQESEQSAESRAARHTDTLRALVGKRSAGEVVREAAKGESRKRERELDEALHLYIDLRDAEDQGHGTPDEQFVRYQDKLSPEQIAAFERSQTLSPQEIALAETIIEENRAMGERGLDAKVLKNVRDNYSARLWEEPPPSKKDTAKYGRFTKKTARAKARTLESILHGWSLGKTLRVRGAISAQLVASKQVAQAIHDSRMVKQGIAAKLLSATPQAEDWIQVEHPNFTHWVWSGKATEGESYGRGVWISEEGDLFHEVPLYAAPKMARALNNILGRSKLYDVKGVETLSRANAVWKHTMLSFSLFHHQAFLRSYLTTPGVAGFRPVKAYQEGRKVAREFGPEVRELVRAGLTIGKIQDYDELVAREKTRIGAAIDKVPGAREFKNVFMAAVGQQTNWLFRALGANLKTMAAIHEYRHLLKAHEKELLAGTERRENLARIAANIANDDFGGLNLQRMQRNPTLQHAFGLLFLAPDWTESNVRSMVRALEKGNEGKAYRAMWGRVFLRFGLASAAFQLAMAAMDDDEDFVSLYKRQWEEGKLRWLEVDITPIAAPGGAVEEGERKFFSVLGHFRDPVKFVAHPVRSVRHKSSVLGRMVLEALTGEDWAGRHFTTWAELLGIDDKGVYQRRGKRSDGSTYEAGDPKGGRLEGQTVKWEFGSGSLDYDQIPSFLLSQAKGVLPIQVQNAMAWLAGEMDGFDALTKSAGLMTSTTWPKEEKK